HPISGDDVIRIRRAARVQRLIPMHGNRRAQDEIVPRAHGLSQIALVASPKRNSCSQISASVLPQRVFSRTALAGIPVGLLYTSWSGRKLRISVSESGGTLTQSEISS